MHGKRTWETMNGQNEAAGVGNGGRHRLDLRCNREK